MSLWNRHMLVLGRPMWAIFDVNLHQRVTALLFSTENFTAKSSLHQFHRQGGNSSRIMGEYRGRYTPSSTEDLQQHLLAHLILTFLKQFSTENFMAGLSASFSSTRKYFQSNKTWTQPETNLSPCSTEDSKLLILTLFRTREAELVVVPVE